MALFILYPLVAAVVAFLVFVTVQKIRTRDGYEKFFISCGDDDVYWATALIALSWPIAAPIAGAIFAALLLTTKDKN